MKSYRQKIKKFNQTRFLDFEVDSKDAVIGALTLIVGVLLYQLYSALYTVKRVIGKKTKPWPDFDFLGATSGTQYEDVAYYNL